jgi:hypothetical protein
MGESTCTSRIGSIRSFFGMRSFTSWRIVDWMLSGSSPPPVAAPRGNAGRSLCQLQTAAANSYPRIKLYLGVFLFRRIPGFRIQSHCYLGYAGGGLSCIRDSDGGVANFSTEHQAITIIASVTSARIAVVRPNSGTAFSNASVRRKRGRISESLDAGAFSTSRKRHVIPRDLRGRDLPKGGFKAFRDML